MRTILSWIVFNIGCFGKEMGDTGVEIEAYASLGEELHAEVCQSCHAPRGDLRLIVPLKTDEELREVILNGEGDMPAQPLTEQELTELIAFLRVEYP